MKTIVVGVDGSGGAKDALRWACQEAMLYGDTKVVAVSTWFAPVPVMSPWLPNVDLPIDLTEPTEKGLADTVAAVVGDEFASVRVEQRVIHGAPGPVLIAEAVHSDLVVVGSRGLGGFKGLLLGSVSHQVVTHAACAVVVVPQAGPVVAAGGPRRIVVGVDGSANSIAALRWAAERAQVSGVTIRAVFAWRLPPVSPTPPEISGGLPPTNVVGHAAAVTLDDFLREAALPPDVNVEPINVEGTPAKVLVDEGAHAELLVLGARGHGGFTGLLLGSVATAVTRHAQCPVAVIPHR
ncbi:MAG: universal stress protein [Acidimicrobiales bacterium]